MKRMLIVLPMSFLLILGGSFFVSANTGEHLNTWYNKQISGIDYLSEEDLSFMEAMIGDLETLISKLDKDISDSRTSTEAQNKQDILNKTDGYIIQVQDAKEELKTQSFTNSQVYKDRRIIEETKQVEEDVEDILNEVLN